MRRWAGWSCTNTSPPAHMMCPDRRSSATTCFDTQFWRQRVNGERLTVNSSYCMKIVRCTKTGDPQLRHAPIRLRIPIAPAKTTIACWSASFPRSTYNGLANPYDIYTHINPLGMMVAYEDGQTTFVPPGLPDGALDGQLRPLQPDRFCHLRRGGYYTPQY